MLCVFKKSMCCAIVVLSFVFESRRVDLYVFVNASVYACLTDVKWNSIVLKPASREEEHEAGSDISGNN